MFHLIDFAGACIVTLLGGLLLGVPIPVNDTRLRSFRTARLYLALSFFILGLLSLSSFFMPADSELKMLVSTFTLTVAYYQALLFTVTTIVFIQPHSITKKFIFRQLLLITCVSVIIFITYFFGQKTIFIAAILAGATIYVILLIYYTHLFHREFAACLAQLEAYYDEDERNRLRWVKFTFYSALTIGVLALVSLFMPLWFYSTFVIIFTIFYGYMVNRFYSYQQVFNFLIPVVTEKKDKLLLSTENEYQHILKTTDAETILAENNRIEMALQKWVDEKRFIQSDIGVDSTACELGISLPCLRHYFKTQKQTDFRTWRLELRLHEAQQLLQDQPELSTNHICEMVGIKDRSNFHRQFLKMTGMTPAAYRQKISNISNSEILNQ